MYPNGFVDHRCQATFICALCNKTYTTVLHQTTDDCYDEARSKGWFIATSDMVCDEFEAEPVMLCPECHSKLRERVRTGDVQEAALLAEISNRQYLELR